MTWKLGPCLYWVFWGVAFAAWETYAGLDKMGHKDIPMLTQLTVKFVPWYVTLPFITWLFIHFAVRYANPIYLRQFEK